MSDGTDSESKGREQGIMEMWSAIELQVDKLLIAEPIKEQQYRGLILAAQIGELLKALTHDNKVNPNARPIGDELSFAGDALIQLLIYLRVRGFPLVTVYDSGYSRMLEQVWRRQPANRLVSKQVGNDLSDSSILAKGTTAVEGKALGTLVVLPPDWSQSKVTQTIRRFGKKGGLIVALEDYTEEVWGAVRNEFDSLKGLLVRYAGITSHPANVCRDHGKPCIVGVTGYENLKSGEIVEILAPADKPATVRLKDNGKSVTITEFR